MKSAGVAPALTAAGLAETLLDRFARNGARTAISYDGDTLSFAQLSDHILRTARDIGPRRAGERVMIVEPDPLASLIAARGGDIFATLRGSVGILQDASNDSYQLAIGDRPRDKRRLAIAGQSLRAQIRQQLARQNFLGLH